MDDFAARELAPCQVSPDGRAVRLRFASAGGEIGAVTLPVECLSALIMTLPALAAAALQAQYRDSSLRIVYPLSVFRLEAATDEATRILTLATPDGFEVSFSLQPETLAALHSATQDECGATRLLQ